MKKGYLILGILLFSWQSFCLAEPLILTSPPRESVQAGEQLYGPLAKYLSDITGMEIVYKHPGNWLKYQRDMRRNMFDVVFDGPHFASWRIKYFNHAPLAKLPGTLKFYLVARAQDEGITKPLDLAAKKVCVIPPPNLSSLVLLSRTDGPAREPVLEAAKGDMKTVYEDLMNGQCEAAMLRSSFYDKKLDEQHRSQLKIIYTSPELPNQVVTVSDRIPSSQYEKISKSLTQGEGVLITQDIVKRFSGNQAKSFITVKNGEYNDYSELLESVILGWKKDR